MDNNEEKKATEIFKSLAQNASEDDLQKTQSEGEEKMQKLSNDIPNALKEVWDRLTLLIKLIGDYWQGNYREVSWQSMTMVIAAVAYFVLPVDAIPDFIPILGYLDDSAVIAGLYKIISNELDVYKIWKEERA